MELDIRQIAEKLIVELWADSDKLRERAEGVRLFLQTIIKEGEKLNGLEHSVDGTEETRKE